MHAHAGMSLLPEQICISLVVACLDATILLQLGEMLVSIQCQSLWKVSIHQQLKLACISVIRC